MRPAPDDTRHRRRRDALAWGLAVATFGILGWVVFSGPRTMSDLVIYREAARALLDHGAVYGQRYGLANLRFTYPPFALFPLLPVSLVPWMVAAPAWFAAQLACLVASTRICLASVGARSTWGRAAAIGGCAALLLHPIRSTLDFGQLNLALLLLILLDAFVLAPRWRGIAIGVASAVKLTPLAFVPWLAAARDARAAVRAVATVLGCTVITWLVLPDASAGFWLHDFLDPGRIGGLPGDPLNQSWRGAAIRIWGEGLLADATWIALAVGGLVVGMMAARRLHDQGLELASIASVGVAALLASPISWPHHWVWCLPVAIAGWSARADRPWLWRATVLLVVTVVGTPWSVTDAPPVRDAYVVAGVLWLLAAATESRDGIRRPGSSDGRHEQPLVLPQVEHT